MGNLVGLGGGLEGRVAGVVLVLVGCGGGKTPVSDLYGGARVVRLSELFPSLGSQARARIRHLQTILLFQNFQTSKQQGRRWYVLAARVVARELMPYAMIRPVSKTALAPLSSNAIPNLRALPRICLSLSISFSFSS